MIKVKEKKPVDKIDCVKLQRKIRTKLYDRWKDDHSLMKKDLLKARKDMDTLFKK